MRRQYIYSIFIFLALLSCAKSAGELTPSGELSQAEKTAISEQVREMFTNYYADIKKMA